MTTSDVGSEGDYAPSDGELVDAIVGGDVAALDALYRRHASLAYGLALRMTGDVALAEDAVQSAFMSLWSDQPGPDGGTDPVRLRIVHFVARASMDKVRRQPPPSRGATRPRTRLVTQQTLPGLPLGG